MTAVTEARKITVLVVDDSAFMRQILRRELGRDPHLEVVGAARDGLEALALVEKLRPDIVTMDVEMPNLNGLAALRDIMSRFPRPVVMLSSLTQEGSLTTLKALELGAVDFVGKPSGAVALDFHKVRDELVEKLKAVARSVNVEALTRPVRAHGATRAPVATSAGKDAARRSVLATRTGGAVIIGSSTGGPRALTEVIPRLPSDFPLPLLVVQHMPAGFTRSLAERLDSLSRIAVREARDGDLLQPGLALVAPGGLHAEVGADMRVRLNEKPPVHGVRPSVDVSLISAGPLLGRHTVAVVLTGMGADGAEGAKLIHEQGGRVIAEHQSTCVVYGMPRSVVEAGVADAVVALPKIAEEIVAQVAAVVN